MRSFPGGYPTNPRSTICIQDGADDHNNYRDDDYDDDDNDDRDAKNKE